ncbi:MAG: UDP-N-acetylmuramate:L-alanyl-gamma-D-glutamyl-meso-diaminopimelate ligase [Gammaproteobacteria bacterium]|nr:UDP-N-acetylmuramate:L-alanyl-gamma-D-glutamyl-meso-diaminopimelate ligase [Gammaproteobacteria bacterium]
MKIHILGICGTFMGGLALIARTLGHEVSGSDANVYPPMSTQLEAAGITLREGYDAAHLDPAPDQVVVGNAMSRGNPAIEAMLERGLRYTSGPQWLAENVLQDRWVLGVAGTHGKTTTASMLAWILEHAGLAPGFLIGGVPENFGVSARAGDAPFFVVEADEYDTAFFDKRSKFVHYRPCTLVLNNLEFDHADIFDDLEAIQRQFHHLVRTVPGNGLIISPLNDGNLHDVLDRGCWTPLEHFDPEFEAGWHVRNATADGGAFDVVCDGEVAGRVEWSLTGTHNVSNALAALAAARHAGVAPALGIAALAEFRNVKRRMELRGEVRGVRVYDDFAHHPTAIRLTLDGLRQHVGERRILAVLEPRSNTMRMGVHAGLLAASLAKADRVWVYAPDDLGWDARRVLRELGPRLVVSTSTQAIVDDVSALAQADDQVLVMSNGGFEGIHQRLLDALAA